MFEEYLENTDNELDKIRKEKCDVEYTKQHALQYADYIYSAQLKDIKAYSKPNDNISFCTKLIVLLFDEEREVKNKDELQQWYNVFKIRLMGDVQYFKEKLKSRLHGERITERQIKKIEPFYDKNKFETNYYEKFSKSTFILAQWIKYIRTIYYVNVKLAPILQRQAEAEKKLIECQALKVTLKKELEIFNESDKEEKQILIEEHLKKINNEQEKMLEELKSYNDYKESDKKKALLLSDKITSEEISEAYKYTNPPYHLSICFKIIVLLFDLENNVKNKDVLSEWYQVCMFYMKDVQGFKEKLKFRLLEERISKEQYNKIEYIYRYNQLEYTNNNTLCGKLAGWIRAMYSIYSTNLKSSQSLYSIEEGKKKLIYYNAVLKNVINGEKYSKLNKEIKSGADTNVIDPSYSSFPTVTGINNDAGSSYITGSGLDSISIHGTDSDKVSNLIKKYTKPESSDELECYFIQQHLNDLIIPISISEFNHYSDYTLGFNEQFQAIPIPIDKQWYIDDIHDNTHQFEPSVNDITSDIFECEKMKFSNKIKRYYQNINYELFYKNHERYASVDLSKNINNKTKKGFNIVRNLNLPVINKKYGYIKF